MLSQSTNATILIQGDSIAEQHFLAMLCHAWTTEGIKVVNLVNHDITGIHNKARWEAQIEPIGITISFARNNFPELAPDIDYTQPDVLIVGGWHHGSNRSSAERMNRFLDQLHDLRHANDDSDSDGRRKLQTLVFEHLPTHFPGVEHIKTQIYPPVKAKNWNDVTSQKYAQDAKCDSEDALYTDEGRNMTSPEMDMTKNYSLHNIINPLIEKWMETKRGSMGKSYGMAILRAKHLYRYRGDAHVGTMGVGEFGPRRDCLHWCVAPGVLDAWALETLSLIHQPESKM